MGHVWVVHRLFVGQPLVMYWSTMVRCVLNGSCEWTIGHTWSHGRTIGHVWFIHWSCMNHMGHVWVIHRSCMGRMGRTYLFTYLLTYLLTWVIHDHMSHVCVMYRSYMGHAWVTWVMYRSYMGMHGVIYGSYGSTMRPRTSETSDKWSWSNLFCYTNAWCILNNWNVPHLFWVSLFLEGLINKMAVANANLDFIISAFWRNC
jgi:hypothetical protein